MVLWKHCLYIFVSAQLCHHLDQNGDFPIHDTEKYNSTKEKFKRKTLWNAKGDWSWNISVCFGFCRISCLQFNILDLIIYMCLWLSIVKLLHHFILMPHLHDGGQELFIKFKISFISVWNTQLWIPYWVLLSYGESRMDFHYNCCRSYNTVMVKFFWVPPETLPMWSYLRGGYFQVRVWHGQCSKTSHKL